MLAIFGLVIAAVFRQYPAAIIPCLIQIPLAIAIGLWLHRQGLKILVPSIVTLGLMYLAVYFGDTGILHTVNMYLASWPIMTWVFVLLIYSYIASVLPVWTLLQPRDYINSLQLLSALALVLAGLVVAGIIGGAPVSADAGRTSLEIVAPMVRWAPEGAPWIFPFLFITIACGAISGFHCLVSSGTTSKQLRCETDAQFVGFGSMLTEGFLAVLVILACVAGIGLGSSAIGAGLEGVTLWGEAAYQNRYATWSVADGLAAKVGAFVEGSANFLKALGLADGFAVALMGVFVASFAATTLDTACRLQRYVIQELASTFRPRVSPVVPQAGKKGPDESEWDCCQKLASGRGAPWHPACLLMNKHGATIFAVVVAGIIAALPMGADSWSWSTAGRGGLILWPLFGATNQLLGGLAFLVITFWLWRRNLPIWFAVPPMAFMLVLPGLAMFLNLFVGENSYIATGNWILVLMGALCVILQIWIVIEAVIAWPKARGVLEEQLEPLAVETR